MRYVLLIMILSSTVYSAHVQIPIYDIHSREYIGCLVATHIIDQQIPMEECIPYEGEVKKEDKQVLNSEMKQEKEVHKMN